MTKKFIKYLAVIQLSGFDSLTNEMKCFNIINKLSKTQSLLQKN